MSASELALLTCSLSSALDGFQHQLINNMGNVKTHKVKMPCGATLSVSHEDLGECDRLPRSAYPDNCVFYRASSTSLERSIESVSLIVGELIESQVGIEDQSGRKYTQAEVLDSFGKSSANA